MTTRRTSINVLALLTLGVGLFAGCGGGGGGGSTPPAGGGPQSTPTAPTQPVAISILFPAVTAGAARRPAYAPSTSVTLTVAVNNAAADTYDVSPTSTSCQLVSGGRSCTFTVNAPVGSDTFALTIWDAPNATGNKLATGSATQTIVAGTANTLTIPLNAVVAKIVLTLANPNPPQGTATSIPLTVAVSDADGNPISTCGGCVAGANQYANPITLTDSDSTYTKISVNGGSGSVVNATTDAVSVAYNGGNLSSAQLSATATAINAAPVSVTQATLTPYGSIVMSPSSVAFTSTGASPQTVQASQAGYSGALSANFASCSSIASVNQVGTGTNPLTLSVAPVGAGTCSVTISGGFSKTATLTITVTTTTITVQ
ncbi:hypothetical protein EPN52_09200 [bacterium]|nr:MAG: hypothetical protein EPN52_09200 [bacterium]